MVWLKRNFNFTKDVKTAQERFYFTDVEFRCADGVVAMHSPMLARASPFLASLMSEPEQKFSSDSIAISLADVRKRPLELLAIFLYTGRYFCKNLAEFASVTELIKMLGIVIPETAQDEMQRGPSSSTSSRDNNGAGCSSSKDLSVESVEKYDLRDNQDHGGDERGRDTASTPVETSSSVDKNDTVAGNRVVNTLLSSEGASNQFASAQTSAPISRPSDVGTEKKDKRKIKKKYCDDDFLGDDDSVDALIEDSRVKEYSCRICHRPFDTKAGLHRHLVKEFMNKLENKLSSEVSKFTEGSGPVPCTICRDHSFTKKFFLVAHYALAHRYLLEFLTPEDAKAMKIDGEEEPSPPLAKRRMVSVGACSRDRFGNVSVESDQIISSAALQTALDQVVNTISVQKSTNAAVNGNEKPPAPPATATSANVGIEKHTCIYCGAEFASYVRLTTHYPGCERLEEYRKSRP